jgi:uncharacterized protein (DUF488 family)
VEVYSVGFTKKSAEEFFELLKRHGVRRLIDVRLNNSSQLAGFTKRVDLEYFLRELCDADYLHQPLLAPTQELLDRYRKGGGTWAEYERDFLELMRERRIEDQVAPQLLENAVLLCSEATPDHCHRRLVLEYLQRAWPHESLTISHL